MTDVVFSVLSVILTVVLLAKFNWQKQFSIEVDGLRVVNWYAITAMFIGYIILPIICYIYKNRIKNS